MVLELRKPGLGVFGDLLDGQESRRALLGGDEISLLEAFDVLLGRILDQVEFEGFGTARLEVDCDGFVERFGTGLKLGACFAI